MIMANQKFAFFVVEMHAVAAAVAEHLAVGADALAGPAAVAVHFETIVPDRPEIVFVDVALVEFRTDARTGGDGTVGQDRGHRDTGLAVIERIAYFVFETTQKTLAGEVEFFKKVKER